ncbi:MAG: hypothetical protein ACKN89_08355 [Cyanobium sp.]
MCSCAITCLAITISALPSAIVSYPALTTLLEDLVAARYSTAKLSGSHPATPASIRRGASQLRDRTRILSWWIALLPAMPGESPAADPGPTEPESQPSPPAPPSLPLPPSPLPPSPPPTAAAPLPPLGLDRQGLLEAAGGSVIALIALFSSDDHITIGGNRVALQQQWGVWLIAASLALVVVDAQLATRSRSREKARLDRDEYRFHREEYRFHRDEYRHQRAEDARQRESLEADRERNRAAERAERQRQAAALANRCALLSGRLQLDPSPTNRDRFRAFLALMAAATASDSLG